MSNQYTYHGYYIRAGMLEALEAYVHWGRPPGGFLFHILSNNLVEAAAAADEENLRNLPAYAVWLQNECPHGMWGSEGAVRGHLERCNRIRREA